MERKRYKTAIVCKVKKTSVGPRLFLNSLTRVLYTPIVQDYFCLSSKRLILVTHQTSTCLEKVVDKVDWKSWKSWFQKFLVFLWQLGKWQVSVTSIIKVPRLKNCCLKPVFSKFFFLFFFSCSSQSSCTFFHHKFYPGWFLGSLIAESNKVTITA